LLRSIGEQFEIPGRFLVARPHGNGHIHRTFAATYEQDGAEVRYVHQHLNTRIFTDPEALMENVVRVTAHVRAKLRALGRADCERRCLTLIAARDGRPFWVDAEGGYWRTYRYLEGARTHETVERSEQAYQAARSFGEFALLLADLGPPPLSVTIPDFHHLGRRFAALEEAVRADPCGRAVFVREEIGSARRRREELEAALGEQRRAEVPRRIVHNDCKLNNVMLDERTGEGLCVIDLDTVMEGDLICDFGDLVRTAAATAPEDERDLAKVGFDLDRFGALARGYLAGAGAILTETELRVLPLAGAVLTLENGIRFLTDHLSGDVYFRIHREGHNLDRTRSQLRLLERMFEKLDGAREAIERARLTDRAW
jgi:aminoglycoside phosphotransferase (APT) family kinase protein